MNTLKVEVIKLGASLVKIKVLANNRILDVPRRVFDRRCELGIYDIANPQVLSSVI